MNDAVPLLCAPAHFRSVDQVLACASKMQLPNVIVISERADGSFVFLDSGMTVSEANWMADRMKSLMLQATFQLKR